MMMVNKMYSVNLWPIHFEDKSLSLIYWHSANQCSGGTLGNPVHDFDLFEKFSKSSSFSLWILNWSAGLLHKTDFRMLKPTVVGLFAIFQVTNGVKTLHPHVRFSCWPLWTVLTSETLCCHEHSHRWYHSYHGNDTRPKTISGRKWWRAITTPLSVTSASYTGTRMIMLIIKQLKPPTVEGVLKAHWILTFSACNLIWM